MSDTIPSPCRSIQPSFSLRTSLSLTSIQSIQGGGDKRLNPLVASAGEARKIEGGRTNSPTRRPRAPDNRRVIGGYPKHYHW